MPNRCDRLILAPGIEDIKKKEKSKILPATFLTVGTVFLRVIGEEVVTICAIAAIAPPIPLLSPPERKILGMKF